MISEIQIKKAQQKTLWDLGNRVLYDLCKKYPYHEQDDQIIAKIWLIGRSYAAAFERGVSDAGDSFYTEKVAPALRESGMDDWLEGLSKFRFPTEANIGEILVVHKKTMDIFARVSGLEKRSLASKYLHFHRPMLFFLYDSRAATAIRSFTEPVGKLPFNKGDVDPDYARLSLRCIQLKTIIKERFGVHLTPRQIDNLLLA